MPNLEDPPPTNVAFANHFEEKPFDNDVEKFEYPPSQQERASPEAERAVVRKLDWRVCLTFHLLLLSILSLKFLC